MLNNGLGELIKKTVPTAKRFVDPFCGAGSVVHHVAQSFNVPVLASDLQMYGKILSGSIIERDKKLNPVSLENKWIEEANAKIKSSTFFNEAVKLQDCKISVLRKTVQKSRKLCEKKSSIGPIWNAYGGHYFSPLQALTIDYLIKYLPKNSTEKTACLAALIDAVSRTIAAPGHTAQPFQPTETAGKFLYDAWHRDIIHVCKTTLKEISEKHAKVKGKTYVDDAIHFIKTKVKEGDLVFIDPPYSGVHYSRFYHVLETIARGTCGPVSGVGRYPDITERPQSHFSNLSQSKKALNDLLCVLAQKKVSVIFTFPKGKCSNGLSGELVKEISRKYFDIDKSSRQHSHDVIVGKFSTLGGNNKLKNNKIKASRVKSEELLLLLKPKK
jgi:adenine-specific DNA methylase